MTSRYEKFWTHDSYAFVGRSARAPFPKLSYREAKKAGKRVFAIDPSVESIDGDRTYPSFDALPVPVDAAVLEPPQDEVEDWVRQAADAGIHRAWIHMGRETPAAIELANSRGLDLYTGTCAVMYLKRGVSYHTLHKWGKKLAGPY